MRTITHLSHIILFALLLISCTTTTVVQPTPTVVTSPTATPTNDISPDVAADIAANYTRWKNANIQHYRFQLMVGCFCPMSSIMPITVEVHDGQVTSMTDVNGTLISPKDPSADFFAQYTTITRIYDELTSSRFRDADKIAISYDPTYGFPSEISVDFIKLAVDDELYLNVSTFTLLQ